jgi:hypothetical protein
MIGRRNGRLAGQAIVETALILPVIVLMVFGTYDGSIFAANQVQAVTAVRNGARTGALLGGKGGANQTTCKGAIPSSFNPSDTDGDADGDQDAIDAGIVQAVLRGTVNMNYITIQEIDVYSPSKPNGLYFPGDPIDRYDGTGKEMESGSPPADTLTQTFNLTSKRCQGITPANESELGVQMTWTYTPANALLGQKTAPCSLVHPCIPNITDWAVEKLAYCDTACRQ